MSRVAAVLVSTLALGLVGCPQESAAPPAAPSPAAPSPSGAGTAEGEATPPAATPPAATPPAATPPAATPPAATQAGSVGGTVTHAGQTMKVEAVVAVWDPKEPGLKLTFLPFTPTPEEVERIRKDEAFFAAIGHEKGLPGFPDRTPFVTLELNWPFQKDAVGDMSAAFCHLYIGFLKESGSNMNLNFPAEGSARTVTLQGKLEPGSEVTVTAKGSDELSGDTMSWDLRFQGPVQAAISKD